MYLGFRASLERKTSAIPSAPRSADRAGLGSLVTSEVIKAFESQERILALHKINVKTFNVTVR